MQRTGKKSSVISPINRLPSCTLFFGVFFSVEEVRWYSGYTQ